MAINAPPRAADFRIYTAGIEALGDASAPVMRGVGSSTVQDLEGDILEITALQDMALAPKGLTIFLNHSYTVPEDVMGGLTDTNMIISNGIADLAITFDVETANPRAVQTYAMSNTRRLGISVGCEISDYVIEDDAQGRSILRVSHVIPLEWSVVGIPANQRCWVEQAAAGLFARTYDPRLAPIVKSLMPRHFGKALDRLTDADQRAALNAIPARPVTQGRLAWLPARQVFTYQTPQATKEREISRADLALLLRSAAPVAPIAEPPAAEPAPALIPAAPEATLPEVTTSEDDMPPETVLDKQAAASLGAHAPMTGTHRHSHSAFGDQGGDATHEHDHSHADDALHEHSHEVAKAASEPAITAAVTPEATPEAAPATTPAPEPTPAPVSDAPRAALLAAYHALGAQLGIRPALIKADDGAPDWQEAVTLASSIDGLADTLTDRIIFLNMQVDTLMDCLGVPDIDDDDAAADEDAVTKAFRLRKAGKRHSRATMTQLTIAHHALAALTDGMACSSFLTSAPAADPDGDADETVDATPAFPGVPATFPGEKAMTDVGLQLTGVATALKGLDVSLIAGNVQKAIETKIAAAQGELTTLTKQLATARTDLAATQGMIHKLMHLPLGNPLSFVRAVTPDEAATHGLATAADLVTSGAAMTTADQAIASTATRRSASGSLVRSWPAGVGPRPPLTPAQDRLMSEQAVQAYRQLGACDVPEFEN